jgi:hypothetical protein
MHKIKLFSLLLFTTLLSGCWSSSAPYDGIKFPKTTHSQKTFLEEEVSSDCTAFAHLLMSSKTHSNGKDIASAMHREAEDKGANLVLLGISRELPDAELTENQFNYYGPEYPYVFKRTWLGWKFGFDEWDEAGFLTNLGADSWGNGNTTYDNSLIIQAVFLHCGQNL